MATKQLICDTDVMVDYFDASKPHHSATKTILEDIVGLNNIFISAITRMELMIGAVNKNDLKKIQSMLNRFNTLLINNEITERSEELIAAYALSHRLALPDSLIAATAICSDMPLFTYNVKDYRYIPKLQLFKP